MITKTSTLAPLKHQNPKTPKHQNTKTLKHLICCFLLLSVFSAKAQDTFQLAPPFIRYQTVFFDKTIAIALQFAQAGTQIHYTTNGEPPSEKDPVYTQPIVLDKHPTTLKARVFGAGFRPSETVEATFFKKGFPISAIHHSAPSAPYTGSSPTALIDGKGGLLASDSKTWMGFKKDTVSIELQLAKPQKVKQVLVEALQNQGAWIFLPQKVELWGQQHRSHQLVLLGTTLLDPSRKDDHAACQAILVQANKKVKTDQLLVKIYPLPKIPAWHPGKGTTPWLFLDEVNLY